LHKATRRAILAQRCLPGPGEFTIIYKHFGSDKGLWSAFEDEWPGVLTQRMAEQPRGAGGLKEKLHKVFAMQRE